MADGLGGSMGSMAGGQPAHVQIQLQQQQMQQQQLQLQKFWVEVLKEIQELDVEREFSRDADKPKRKESKPKEDQPDDPRLPLARIKKIMKIEDEIKVDLGAHRFMISAEAPIVFQKACEIFIREVTLRAWTHTEENKRRTLQKTDISMAVSKSDQFDFLIDIVPRDEAKPTKKEEPTRAALMDPAQLYMMQPQMMMAPSMQMQDPQQLQILQQQQLNPQMMPQMWGQQGLYYQPSPHPGHGGDFQSQAFDPSMLMSMAGHPSQGMHSADVRGGKSMQGHAQSGVPMPHGPSHYMDTSTMNQATGVMPMGLGMMSGIGLHHPSHAHSHSQHMGAPSGAHTSGSQNMSNNL